MLVNTVNKYFPFKTPNIGPLEKCINCHQEVPLLSFRQHMSICPGGSSRSSDDQIDIGSGNSESSETSVRFNTRSSNYGEESGSLNSDVTDNNIGSNMNGTSIHFVATL